MVLAVSGKKIVHPRGVFDLTGGRGHILAITTAFEKERIGATKLNTEMVLLSTVSARVLVVRVCERPTVHPRPAFAVPPCPACPFLAIKSRSRLARLVKNRHHNNTHPPNKTIAGGFSTHCLLRGRFERMRQSKRQWTTFSPHVIRVGRACSTMPAHDSRLRLEK